MLRSLVVGTPLEPIARRVYRQIRPPKNPDPMGYDAQTRRVIEKVLSPASNCVDVGCHQGQIMDMILARSPSGHHIGVEPLPDFAERLSAKYGGISNVSIVEAALSDAQGTTSFQFVVSRPAYSGIRRRPYPSDTEDVVEISVNMVRLDDLVPEHRTIALIKIDVEGGEMGVLRGSERVLRKDRPYVMFEHGVDSASGYGTRSEDVFDFLADVGLHVSLMADWLDGQPPLTRDGFLAERSRNYMFLAHP